MYTCGFGCWTKSLLIASAIYIRYLTSAEKACVRIYTLIWFNFNDISMSLKVYWGSILQRGKRSCSAALKKINKTRHDLVNFSSYNAVSGGSQPDFFLSW